MIKLDTYIPESLEEVDIYAHREADENYQHYYAYNRTPEEIKKHVYHGKYAELLIAYLAHKNRHAINMGCSLFADHPDNGTDLIIDNIPIQVKSCPDKYFSFYKRDMLQKLKAYTGIILVYSFAQNKIFELTKDILNYRVFPSKFGGYYVRLDDLKEYTF